ncbi:MAG: iron(III) transport system substrate-binding protein [Xanthobacteraceae bacterium]|nr:MAG: iron(III) transport system substrate-binding protein [Xanthobacteraceae bacterium]
MTNVLSAMRFCLILALCAGGASSATSQARTPVTLYTSIETDQLAAFKVAIEKDLPDIEVRWVRDSTGVITARVLAERANPRADMIFGLAATSLLLFAQTDMLEPYRPKGADELKPAFRDDSGAHRWTGMNAYVAAICFNRDLARAVGAPPPARWHDLLHPSLRQRIVMPHPASSGTGFLLVAGWIQMMGEEAAWTFMESLHQNVALYTHSGSAPCVQAARGERVLGLSFDMRGAREKGQGAPIDVIVPEDGAGWEMEAFALVRDRPKDQAEAARRIADWATSRRANELYAQFYAVVAHRDVRNRPAHYPPHAEERMLRSDFSWMAQNRDRILAEWSRRFDGRLPGAR